MVESVKWNSVLPVGVVWSKFFVGGTFNLVGPCWHLYLSAVLEEVGESDNKLLLVNIFHTGTWHVDKSN